MDARFDGVVLGGQAEGVKAHGMEYIVPLHPLKPGIGIAGAVVIPMAHMQLGRGRVGEHLQHVEFFLQMGIVEGKQFVFLPFLLPLLLHFTEIHGGSTPLFKTCAMSVSYFSLL